MTTADQRRRRGQQQGPATGQQGGA
jgi:hypothetical protein